MFFSADCHATTPPGKKKLATLPGKIFPAGKTFFPARKVFSRREKKVTGKNVTPSPGKILATGKKIDIGLVGASRAENLYLTYSVDAKYDFNSLKG